MRNAQVSIKAIDSRHVILAQIEVPDLEILFESDPSDRFRNDGRAALDSPANSDLSRCLEYARIKHSRNGKSLLSSIPYCVSERYPPRPCLEADWVGLRS